MKKDNELRMEMKASVSQLFHKRKLSRCNKNAQMSSKNLATRKETIKRNNMRCQRQTTLSSSAVDKITILPLKNSLMQVTIKHSTKTISQSRTCSIKDRQNQIRKI